MRSRTGFQRWFRCSIPTLIVGIRKLRTEGDTMAARRWETWMLDVLEAWQ